MYLILHLIILMLAIIFMILGSVLKRSGDYYQVEGIAYLALAFILFSALAVSGTVEYTHIQPIPVNMTIIPSGNQTYTYVNWSRILSIPIIANITNDTSGTQYYSYTVFNRSEVFPIISHVSNPGATYLYSYDAWSYMESYPIYPINLVYLLLAIINLLLIFYRSFQALRG